MAGIESINSKLKKLGQMAETVALGELVSVVYFDEDGVIDWPDKPNEGVMAVPRPVSLEGWIERFGTVR